MYRCICLATLSVFFLLPSASALSASLQESLEATYQTNPHIQAAFSTLRAEMTAYNRANANFRPDVRFSSSAGIDHQKTNGASSGGLTPRTASLLVRQPLFRGWRSLAQEDRAGFNVAAAEAAYARTVQDTLLEASVAYLDVRRYRSEVDLNSKTRDVLARQYEAAEARFTVGEVTKTDVSQAEARLERAKADLLSAEANLRQTLASLDRLTGISTSPDESFDISVIEDLEAALPSTLSDAYDRAMQLNYDINAAKALAAAAESNIEINKGAFWPEISLVADAGYGADTSRLTDESHSAGVRVQLDMPLYAQGLLRADESEAKLNASSRQAEVVSTTRLVNENVTSLWHRLSAARSAVKARMGQVVASELALEGVTYEQEFGERTVLDILDAEQELLDSQVALTQAERDVSVLSLRLLAATGGLMGYLESKLDFASTIE